MERSFFLINEVFFCRSKKEKEKEINKTNVRGKAEMGLIIPIPLTVEAEPSAKVTLGTDNDDWKEEKITEFHVIKDKGT